MKSLIIEGTFDTPAINFDFDSGILEIAGRSLPEDVNEFYTPVLDWIGQLRDYPKKSVKIVSRMEYFNTASSKILLDMFMILEELKDEGMDVAIEWYFNKEEEDMEEAGEEFADLVEVPFKMCTY